MVVYKYARLDGSVAYSDQVIFIISITTAKFNPSLMQTRHYCLEDGYMFALRASPL